jgi:hypothetical protein
MPDPVFERSRQKLQAAVEKIDPGFPKIVSGGWRAQAAGQRQ